MHRYARAVGPRSGAGRLVLVMCVVMIAGWLAPAPSVATPRAGIKAVEPAADTSTALVEDRIAGYTLARGEPKAIWYATPICEPATTAITTSPYAEAISRIATYGSPVRRLYYRVVNSTCGQQDLQLKPTSNIIADDKYVYFTQAGQLVRISTDANVGDRNPIRRFGTVAPSGTSGLAQDDDEIFMITPGLRGHQILRINKQNGAVNKTTTISGGYDRDFSYDGEYLYWIDFVGSDSHLRRFKLESSVLTTISGASANVSAYYAEGARRICLPSGCISTTKYVFIARGRSVYRYDNVHDSETDNPIYTSSDSSARVYDMVSDGKKLFLWETRQVSCDPFCSNNAVLFRTSRFSSSSPDLINAINVGLGTPPGDLRTDGTFLYYLWQGIRKLPNNVDELPQTTMNITAVEITQAMQDLLNTVPLIDKKRTFVRLHVQSTGPAVPGVTAHLYRLDSNGQPIGSPLLPVNDTGTTITVQPTPDRNNLNDAFLFELPWSWTTGSLRLRAELNPYRVPIQSSYANNTRTVGPFTFKPSPRLVVQFVAWGYVLNNKLYYPRFAKDIVQTYSWVRRAYPVASTPGFIGEPSAGFRPNLWLVGDDELGSRVDRSDPACTTLYPEKEDRSLCASHYTNTLMGQMRTENGDPQSLLYYGMISDAAGIFPRGQAFNNRISSGPVGQPGSGSWDTDGAYGDWYAGHEIGHTLGRAHPNPNSDDPDTKNTTEGCGHSRSDPGYPYEKAAISPPDNRFAGFDAGDAEFKIPRAVLPGTQWTDMMSYCDFQWISDYTYKGMYNFMTGGAGLDSAPPPQAVSGDFLSVFGVIRPSTGQAEVPRLRRLSQVGTIPPRAPGNWSIQLLDSNGQVLKGYAFTPEESDDDPDEQTLMVGQVVPYEAGTSTVRIIRLADNKVFWSKAVSANPPAVTNVALQGATTPVSGTVTLAWNASDADGDPLRFDILYTRNGGASYQPIATNLTGTSETIDTSKLGGGTGRLRVIASDGVHTARADSAPFTIANKPPQPHIVTPASTTTIQWGQLVNFMGEAYDVQDGSVAANRLEWRSSRDGLLGTGPLLSVDDLSVGTHGITLKATNSTGASASEQVTVVVGDDLLLPEATLSVGPTRVGWQVSAGTTAQQTKEIRITNAGDGILQWSATENAAWLELSATSGTAPGVLTLTANPTGLAPNTSRTTTVTITRTSPGGPPESIAIPVTLSSGTQYIQPDVFEVLSIKVLVPLVRR